MKIKNLPPELREQLAAAAQTLKTALKRARGKSARLEKLSGDFQTLEDRHYELTQCRTLSSQEAQEINTVITQKQRMQRTLEQEEAAMADETQKFWRQHSDIANTIHRLSTVATVQVQDEYEAANGGFYLTPYNARNAATQTELYNRVQNCFRRAEAGIPGQFASQLSTAQYAIKLFEDILDDRHFFHFKPEDAAKEMAAAQTPAPASQPQPEEAAA